MRKYPLPPLCLVGHRGHIFDLAISPDSRLLVTGSVDCTARLWDIQTGELLRTHSTGTPVLHIDSFNRDYHINSVAFLPDSTTALLGGVGMPQFWDVQTGKLSRPWHQEGWETDGMTVSPDGLSLLIISDHTFERAELRHLKTGELLQTFEKKGKTLNKAAFSPDGRTIITGSDSSEAYLWDVASGEIIHILSGHTGWVISVAFSPDGRTILTGSKDTTARLWDAATGETIHIFERHYLELKDAVFCLNGRHMMTCSADGSIRYWNIETGEHEGLLGSRPMYASRLRFTPDGRSIVIIGGNAIEIWENELETL
jgi:WD40 repeat protein